MSLPEPAIAKRYFETVGERRSAIAEAPPVCVYLEVTNRCNLLCETCPRTFEALEPPADMSWELFTGIVDQLPGLARAVLHGVGEPMMVKDLPRMIRYLKDRGVYVLFNTNGTLLAPRKRRELIATGLDELRVSLDAADAASFLKVRGKDMFDRIVRNVGEFTALQREIGAAGPRVSLWLTGLKETIDQLPEFVRLAARIGVRRGASSAPGVRRSRPRPGARANPRCSRRRSAKRRRRSRRAQAIGRALGVSIDASGATEPGTQPEARRRGAALVGLPAALVADVFHRAWPRAALLHRAVLGARLCRLHAGRRHAAEPARDLERRRLSGVPRRADLRRAAAAVRELRAAMEPLSVAVVIPTLNEAAAIAAVVGEIPRDLAAEIIVVDGGSSDGTDGDRRGRRRARDPGGRGAATAAPASPAPRPPRPPAASSCSWTATAPIAATCMARLVEPIRAGTHDFVIASRARGERETGAMSWHQLAAGYLAGRGIGALYGVRYSDMCAYRAIRRDCLAQLGMREMGYGWNIEMQMKAARRRLRILELPMPYRRRRGGRSKVAGSLGGTLRAGGRIIATFLRVAAAG